MITQWKRQCPECGRELFYNNAHTLQVSNSKKVSCRSCGRKRNVAWAKIHYSDPSQHSRWKGCGKIPGSYFWQTMNGAKSKNREFSITIENMSEQFEKQNEKCVYTGLDLTFGKCHTRRRGRIYYGKDRTASLDRIDSSRGYTKNNIQWVHKDINIMKSNFSGQRFVELCDMVSQRNVETPIDIFIRNNRT